MSQGMSRSVLAQSDTTTVLTNSDRLGPSAPLVHNCPIKSAAAPSDRGPKDALLVGTYFLGRALEYVSESTSRCVLLGSGDIAVPRATGQQRKCPLELLQEYQLRGQSKITYAASLEAARRFRHGEDHNTIGMSAVNGRVLKRRAAVANVTHLFCSTALYPLILLQIAKTGISLTITRTERHA